MAFTYTPGTDIARVRAALGDRDADTAQFSDEEIADAVTEEGSWRAAVAFLAKGLLAHAARRARNFTGDQGSVDETAALAYLQDLVERYQVDAATDAPSSTLPLAVVSSMGRAPNDPYYVIGGGS